jgi:hypothetical protein
VKEQMQLGWTLTGIGGSADPLHPYDCVITGSGGSTGSGIYDNLLTPLDTRTVSIAIKNGDTVTCTFENTGNGATRTQGFWATHPQLAAIAWNGGTEFGHTFPGVGATPGIGDRMLCGDTLTINASKNPLAPANNSELMGGFWSSISTLTTGVKRGSLSQSKMQLLQQLLAAELNASATRTRSRPHCSRLRRSTPKATARRSRPVPRPTANSLGTSRTCCSGTSTSKEAGKGRKAFQERRAR